MPYQEEKTLKEVLLKMMEVYKLKGKLNQTRIRSLWEELMGPSIARQTTELRIHHKKLYVQLQSASLRNELSYGREKIKDMINERLGERYLEDVILR
jgi:predicted nucleic acid-binding Zn ribbon protein